VVPFTEL